ncbi:hypothetical protein FRB99_007250 [Tulasnella sp. 403]|nr:hypothetical protein FRB99_007250 [Tulasnella sp. 403]
MVGLTRFPTIPEETSSCDDLSVDDMASAGSSSRRTPQPTPSRSPSDELSPDRNISRPMRLNRSPARSSPSDPSLRHDQSLVRPMVKSNRRVSVPLDASFSVPSYSSAPSSYKTPERPSLVSPSTRVSQSPRTPYTPGFVATPSTASPLAPSRRPRYHHSSDTPLRDSAAFPTPPSIVVDKPRTPRVRFTSDTRSLPRFTATITPPIDSPTPSTSSSRRSTSREPASSSLEPVQVRKSRRKSVDFSAKAASASGSGTWQRKVAEEMVRLSVGTINNSNSSISSGSARRKDRQHSKHSSQSSDDFRERAKLKLDEDLSSSAAVTKTYDVFGKETRKLRRPNSATKRRDKENDEERRRKLESLVPYPSTESIQVHVVKQEESFPGEPWKLSLDLPTPSLGFSDVSTASDVPFRFGALDKGKENEASPQKLGDAPSSSLDSPRKRSLQERRRRPRDRTRTLSQASRRMSRIDSSTSATTDIPSASDPSGPSSPPRPTTIPHSTSSPSLRAPLQHSTPVRVASSQSLGSPSTPPRSGATSPVARSSPGDSPARSRHRLSSIVDAGSLFFPPRTHPPEDYELPLPKSSDPPLPSISASTTPSSLTSLAGPAPPIPNPAGPSVPQIDREDLQREEDAISLGKGRGKRLGPDVDHPTETVPPLPTLSTLTLPAERLRKESNLSILTGSSADVLGELPVSPRKKLKLATSAALVQSLTDAVAAQEAGPSRTSEEPSPIRSKQSHSSEGELKSILHRKHQSLSPPASTVREEEVPASRPTSRRSLSVSFQPAHVDLPTEPSLAVPPPVVTSPSRRRSMPLSFGMSPAPGTIPFMAIISPRPASLVTTSRSSGQYLLHEPHRYSSSLRSPTSASAASTLLDRAPQSMRSPLHDVSFPGERLPPSQTLPAQGHFVIVCVSKRSPFELFSTNYNQAHAMQQNPQLFEHCLVDDDPSLPRFIFTIFGIRFLIGRKLDIPSFLEAH